MAQGGKIKHMCKAALSMHLRQCEAFILLICCLVSQTTYVMPVSQFTEKQCHVLDALVMRVFLPLMKINHRTPRALVHGPLQYGGMDIVKHSALQDQWGLYYFVQTLRWDDIIANDAYQLASGFVSCVMMIPTIQIMYFGAGCWILHLRARLSALDGSMSIEKAWAPHLQRRDDDSIMEVIADSKGLTGMGVRTEIPVHKSISFVASAISRAILCLV